MGRYLPRWVRHAFIAGTRRTYRAAPAYERCSLLSIRICCASGATGVLRHTPQRVLLPARTMIRAVSMGRAHVMALASTGQLFTWGMGLDGRLGHGDTVHRDGPSPVAALEDAGVDCEVFKVTEPSGGAGKAR